jgi:hypothetical protein
MQLIKFTNLENIILFLNFLFASVPDDFEKGVAIQTGSSREKAGGVIMLIPIRSRHGLTKKHYKLLTTLRCFGRHLTADVELKKIEKQQSTENYYLATIRVDNIRLNREYLIEGGYVSINLKIFEDFLYGFVLWDLSKVEEEDEFCDQISASYVLSTRTLHVSCDFSGKWGENKIECVAVLSKDYTHEKHTLCGEIIKENVRDRQFPIKSLLNYFVVGMKDSGECKKLKVRYFGSEEIFEKVVMHR